MGEPLIYKHFAHFIELCYKYNIKNDKYELNNLANEPKLKVIQDNLFAELKSWMNQQGDLGIPTEMKALTRFKGDTLHWKKAKD